MSKPVNVYVYLVRFANGTLEAVSYTSRTVAEEERRHDRDYLGFRVSPIAKVSVPRPEARS